jgi:DNA-binding transcriptional ArsR family regulator
MRYRTIMEATPVRNDSESTGGWRVRRSIALELDVATYFVQQSPAALPQSLIDLAVETPPIWIEEFEVFDRSVASHREQPPFFEYLAPWAQVETVEDYDVATGAMREITVHDAIDRIVEMSDLRPAHDIEPLEQLVDLGLRSFMRQLERIGVYPASDAGTLERERENLQRVEQVLRGGTLHGRFWHWMDRFYYEVYRPWRETRLGVIATLEQTAIAGLGRREGGGPPALDWLPPDHSLVAFPATRAAAEAGEFEVVFWAEPFGLDSAAVIAPGLLITSFAEHGIDRTHSIAVRDDLVAKLRALADPTRLHILRMIRSFDADNTQIAGFLNVSRPTVSVHAKTLAEAGFISTERDGRQARHSFHPNVIRELCDGLLRYLDVPADAQDE